MCREQCAKSQCADEKESFPPSSHGQFERGAINAGNIYPYPERNAYIKKCTDLTQLNTDQSSDHYITG